MELLHELHATPVSAPIPKPQTVRVNTQARKELRQQFIAWMGIAIIGIASLVAVYILWIRTAPGA